MMNTQSGNLPLNPWAWGDEISVFGPLAFLIGARRLGRLEPNHKPLEPHTLKAIDSYCFSKRMVSFSYQPILHDMSFNLYPYHGNRLNFQGYIFFFFLQNSTK